MKDYSVISDGLLSKFLAICFRVVS